MRSTKILLLLVSLTTISFAQSDKLEIQSGAVSIGLEENWNVQDGNGSYKINFLPDKEHVNVLILSREEKTLHNIFDSYVENMDETYVNPKIINEGTETYNTATYKWISFDIKINGQKIRFISYFTVQEYHAYVFIFSTNNIKKYQPIFEAFLHGTQYNKPDIKSDSKLEKLINKKCVIKSALTDGFPDTNMKERNHYFLISTNGVIRFFDRYDNILFESLFTYDPNNSTLHFYRESRPSQLTIDSITDNMVSFKGSDYLKSSIFRTYRIVN